MFVKFTLTLALVGVVLAAPSTPQYGYTHPAPTQQDPPKYDFNYAVKDDYSNNDFGHHETRDGYNTQGSYYVLLPDGRLQRVAYTVNGDSGFVAEVTYEGEAQYQHQPASYHPTPAPYHPTPAPYHPTPAPYHPTPAPYHPTPTPYHPTPAPYH